MGKIDWKASLGMIAPALGAAVSTLNPMAGAAITVLSNVLLGHPNGTEDDIAIAMGKATPEQLLVIKQEDHNFQLAIGKLGIDLEALDQKDRESARGLGVQTSLMPQMVLTAIYSIGYFVALYQVSGTMLGEVKIATELLAVYTSLIGVLTAVQVQIMNFWFGSSKSSHDKTNLLGQK